MKQAVNLTLDKDLVEQARIMHINLSDVLNTMLKSFLQGTPKRAIRKYAQLDKKQKKWVEKKLLKITKEIYAPETEAK